MSLRDHFQRIYDERGVLTPRVVVDVARDPAHPLHSRFEWDDAIAGERYREVQAAELLRKAKVVYRESTGRRPPGEIRAFTAVRTERGNEYRPTAEVADDPFLREMVLRDAEREWKQLKARYQHLAEFFQMVRADVESA